MSRTLAQYRTYLRENATPSFTIPTTKKVVRILLVDTHVLMRTALQRIVASIPQVEIVANCNTVQEALKTVNMVEVDVVVVSVSIPLSECSRVINYKRENQSQLELVVIRSSLRSETVLTLVKQGVHGLLDEFASERDLADAITTVSGGNMFLNRHAREILAVSVSQAAISLTVRELEVISLLKHGESNFRIAQALGLREKTVEAYLTRIYSKLAVNSRAEAIVYLQETDI